MSEPLLENTWNPVTLGSKSKGGYTISTYEVSSSWYNQHIKNTGDRLTRLQRYHDMDCSTIEISRALDILSEDVSSCNADDNETFVLEYPEEAKILKTTIKLMNATLETWKKRTGMECDLFTRVRNTLKYGATFYQKQKDGTLKALLPERFIGYIVNPEDEDIVTHYIYDPSAPKLVDINNKGRTRDINTNANKNEILSIPVEDLVIFKIGEGPFGESVLEKVFVVWKQMTLLEDAVIIYRVVRAPERRLFYIDVGNLQGPKREAAIERQRLRLQQKQSNRSGKLTTDYDPHSTSEDIFIPTNSTGKGSRVETLPGGQNLGELSDLEYFSRKLAAGLRIPHSMIDTHGDQQQQYADMRVGQMYQIEMRYMGYVKRLSAIFAKALDENFKEFCWRREILYPEGMCLTISPPSGFAIYKEMEIQQTMLNVFNSTAQLTTLSKKYAMQKFLHMDQEELLKNEIDKLQELGLSDEDIKKMPQEHIDNLVYGNGRVGSEYGIEQQEGSGFGGF